MSHRPEACATGNRFRTALLVLSPLLLAGCADRQLLHRTCPDPAAAVAAAGRPAPHPDYRIGCPDVLEVAFADRPDWDAVASVDLDGRLPLDDAGRPRVEGLTVPEARDAIAHTANVPADGVRVRLAAPRAGRVFVHGPTRGRLRAVPYQGAETAVAFLRRVGGLPPGAKLERVYVVRPNVAAGGPPEVFHVDAAAALEAGDRRTDIPLMPSDQVYVGETNRASVVELLPEWLRPLYRQLAGLLPDDWWPLRAKEAPRGGHDPRGPSRLPGDPGAFHRLAAGPTAPA